MRLAKLLPYVFAAKMKVILSIDQGDHSRVAAQEVMERPWPQYTTVNVITVLDNSLGSADAKRSEEARAFVESIAAEIRQKNSSIEEVEANVITGNPKAEILNLAERSRADLLVVGSRGRKGLQRLVLGSVSHALLLSIPCSILIARKPKGRFTSNKVLMALDDSRFSDMVVEIVVRLPWPADGEMLCVTAVPALSELMADVKTGTDTQQANAIYRKQYDQAEHHLKNVCARLGEKVTNVPIKYEILDGDPRETVIQKAKDWNAGLVMTGCRGKDWINRMLIGSVSEAVATWSECSVAVVKV